MATECMACGCTQLINGTDCPRCGAVNSEEGGSVSYDPDRVKEVLDDEDSLKIRASSAPLAFLCPGSLRSVEGEVRVSMSSEPARRGSGIHFMLSRMVNQSSEEGESAKTVSLKYGVDEEELSRLVSYGQHAWTALAEYFPNPVTEQELKCSTDDFELTGHIDLISMGDGWANFLDYKSGWKQPDYFDQMMAYCLLIFETYPEVQEVRATLVWLREWTRDTVLITRKDAEEWVAEFLNEVVYWNGLYSAGSHCSFCPRFTTCPARQALVRSAVQDIEAIETEPTILSAVTLYREGKLSVMKRILTQVETMIRAHLEAVGPIDLGNGRELALVPEPRDKIEPLAAWPIISEALTNEELAPAIKIGKTALLDAVADKAPRGRKGKVKAELMEALKAAEAVVSDTIWKQVERKIEPKPVQAPATT